MLVLGEPDGDAARAGEARLDVVDCRTERGIAGGQLSLWT